MMCVYSDFIVSLLLNSQARAMIGHEDKHCAGWNKTWISENKGSEDPHSGKERGKRWDFHKTSLTILTNPLPVQLQATLCKRKKFVFQMEASH